MVYVCGVCVFFFQAEDGIRDLVRSRGLGDVYKRQGYDRLEGDAADNPLVQLRGSEDQASIGVFVSYRFF